MSRRAARIATSWILIGAWLLTPVAQAAAGRTPGSFVVSPSGAATYTIPIWAPPGPGSIQPNVALTYNSQTGNGFVGVGWSLSGLSVLTRCNQTYAQDPVPAPVQLITGDALCLDGKRLRLTSGTQGIAGSTYQAEIADFSNVTAFGTSGNGPAYFRVQHPNGLTYEYGNGGNSQVTLTSAGVTTALRWMLDKVTDPAGNSMTISYVADASAPGTVVPSTISWTPSSAGSTSYAYSMTFSYLTAPAAASLYGYVAGASVVSNQILNTISINYGASLVKEYFLTYQVSSTTGRYELITVKECADSAQTNCLSPTSVTYQSGIQGLSASALTVGGGVAANNTADVVTGYDLNGDGINDLAVWVAGTWWVAFGTPTGFGTAFNSGVPDAGQLPLATFASVDGSGTDGILVPRSGVWWFYKWNGSAFAGVSTATAVDLAIISGNQTTAILSDVNGDGLPDLVYQSSNGFIRVMLNTTSGGTPSFSSSPINTVSWQTYGISALWTFPKFDFFGDGQQDVLAKIPFASGGVAVLHFSGGTLSISAASDNALATVMDAADYNNDGCKDLLSFTELDLAGCDGSPGVALTFNGDQAVAGISWDGSGEHAVVVNHGGMLGVYKVQGFTLSPLIMTSIPFTSAGVYQPLPNAMGDGLDGLLVWTDSLQSHPIQYYLHNGTGQPPDLLTSITDGYNNSASPTYVSIDQNNYSQVYNSSFPDRPSYPDRYYTGPLYVTNQVTYSDPSSAANGTYQQTFWYYDAWTNLQGRGFGGFKQMQQHDSRNGLWDTLGFAGTFPSTGVLAFDLSSQDQAGNQKVNYTFANVASQTQSSVAGDQRYFVYYNNVTSQSYELGGAKDGSLIKTTSTSYTYDNYGNPTAITTTVRDSDAYSGKTWTTATTTTPQVDTTNWCLTLLSGGQTVYTASDGETSVTRTMSYTPDTAHCRYTALVTEPNSPTYKVTEALGYDAFGNISTDTLTGIGMVPRQSVFNWGTTGQFPMSVIDPTGAQTQINYNFSFGVPSSVLDVNGHTTSWGLDAFGREVLESHPDGTSTQFTYNACAPPNTCAPLWRTFVWRYDLDTQGNKQAQAVTTYDASDRPIEFSALALNGSWSTVINNYDSLGRTVTTTLPFFFGATQYNKTYTYDPLNRLLQMQVPTNASNSTPQTTKYTYSGDTVTVTDADNNLKTLVSDPNGWLRQVTDATNYTVTLGYDAAGSADSVTDNLSNTLWTATYQYGADAYPVAINDADLGPWTYTFNALGENTAWVDAKGQHFSQTFDALSRLVSRREPDLYTQWTWGTSAAANNIGRLQSVCTGTGTNPTTCTSSGYSQSRTYDNLERPSQFSIAIPGDATYTYTATYNGATGYLDTLTYPATPLGPSLQVKFAYVNGALQSLTNVTDSPNVTFWTANQVNQMGAASQETFGNGVVLNHAFDAVTFHPSAITAGPGGGATLQNNSYLFDGVGNLTQRQDNNAGTTESVFYDSLNRLSHTLGDTNTTMSYDGMGRLTTWSAYGNTVNTEDYTAPQSGCTYYNNAQPHAVRKNTQGSFIQTFCYDANGNLTVHNITGSGSATQTWTSFNQPSTTTSPFGSSQFLYNHNHQRWQQAASFSGSPETTTYIGGLLEKVVNSQGTAYRHYIPVGNTFVEYVRSTSTGNSTYYVTKDHLGSTAAITDHTGALVVNEKYSALGWNENTAAQETTFGNITRHEYTGEEGVDSTGVGIANLNNRLYSPSGSYFFSPDPNTPDVTDTRSYNRYAYASYNPLTRIDPTGLDDGDFGENFGDDGSGSDDGSGDPCNDCRRSEDYNPPPREVVQDPDGRTWLCVLTPGCILILQDPSSSPDNSTPPPVGPDNTPPTGDPNSLPGQNPPATDGSGGLPPIFGGGIGNGGFGGAPSGPAPITPPAPSLLQVGLNIPKPRGYNINLLLHELAGGHTIAMHVARSLDFLRRRTMGDDPVPAASAFLNLKLATSLINMTLNYNRAKIAAMMAIEGEAHATILSTFDKPTGYRYQAGKGNIADVYSVFIVLQKPAATPEGFLVFTAFPVPP